MEKSTRESDSKKYMDELEDMRARVMREDGTVDWMLFDDLGPYGRRALQFLDWDAGNEVVRASEKAMGKTARLLIKKGVLTDKPPYWALCGEGRGFSGLNPSVPQGAPHTHSYWHLYFKTLEHAREYAAALHEHDITDIEVLLVTRVEEAYLRKEPAKD